MATKAKVTDLPHPMYTQMLPTWNKLADVREGTGGFKDGTYLIAHPREWLDYTKPVTENGVTRVVTNPNPSLPSAKLKARRKLASYNNLGAAILDAFKGPLFRESPVHRVGDGKSEAQSPLEEWWDDIYRGNSINEMMPLWWDRAATFGHIVLLFELGEAEAPVEGVETTAADQELPKVCWYSPRDVINWIEDEDGQITAIKVVEAVTPTDFSSTQVNYRVRVVNETEWILYDEQGAETDRGKHGLGRVPFVFLFAQRSPSYTSMGKSVLGDPNNHIDLFNLESEKRELLRNQTFSFINLPLGTGPDAMSVEQAQNMMGQQTGTMNVLFSAQPASILSGDSANVEAYENSMDSKRREIYREAGVQWESDTKDAEAEGSLALKREDMETRLSQMANECQAAEYELAELFYRWKYGADRGQKRLDEDNVVIQYPDHFQQKPFEELQLQIDAAASLNYPPEVIKELQLLLLPKFEGMSSLPDEKLKALKDAIVNAEAMPTPAERMQHTMKLKTMATEMQGKAPSGPADPIGKAA